MKRFIPAVFGFGLMCSGVAVQAENYQDFIPAIDRDATVLDCPTSHELKNTFKSAGFMNSNVGFGKDDIYALGKRVYGLRFHYTIPNTGKNGEMFMVVENESGAISAGYVLDNINMAFSKGYIGKFSEKRSPDPVEDACTYKLGMLHSLDFFTLQLRPKVEEPSR